MKLTQQETEVIQELLARYDIFVYEVVAIPEGNISPEGVRSMSGEIVTPFAIYEFWLDWSDGSYTLGEEDGYWEEVDVTGPGGDNAFLREIQRKLREKISSSQ